MAGGQSIVPERGYHHDPDSFYPLPNDEAEHDRLDEQHDCLMSLMHNQPLHSPVDSRKAISVLDIGCGSGKMTLLLAKHFPNAKIYGIDLSPVPPQTKSAAERLNGRVEFIEGNILKLIGEHPALQPGTFDFVFHRFLVAALSSYEDYLREAVFTLLAPGGWVEMHDLFALKFYQADPNVPGTARCISRDWHWLEVFKQAPQQRAKQDLFAAVITLLQILDFRQVKQKMYRLPWARVAGHPEMDDWADYAPQGIANNFSAGVPKALGEDGMKSVDAEALERSIRETVGSRHECMFWPLGVVWARKPLKR